MVDRIGGDETVGRSEVSLSRKDYLQILRKRIKEEGFSAVAELLTSLDLETTLEARTLELTVSQKDGIDLSEESPPFKQKSLFRSY